MRLDEVHDEILSMKVIQGKPRGCDKIKSISPVKASIRGVGREARFWTRPSKIRGRATTINNLPKAGPLRNDVTSTGGKTVLGLLRNLRFEDLLMVLAGRLTIRVCLGVGLLGERSCLCSHRHRTTCAPAQQLPTHTQLLASLSHPD
jgi:hypothetical protein